jgi:hypothetical protein
MFGLNITWSKVASALVLGVLLAACAQPTDDSEPRGQTDSELVCAAANTTKLVSVAKQMDGRSSQHRCYSYVKQHMRAAGMSTAHLESHGYGASAYQFATWAKAYPSELQKMGLQKSSVDVNNIPKGSVIVWPRGACGYSSDHGHIEIVVDDNSSRACSDFCGRVKKGCGKPDIFVPSGCATGPKPSEGDPDNSVQAPTTDDDGKAPTATTKAVPTGTSGVVPALPPSTASAPSTDDGGDWSSGAGCWSPTRNAQSDEGECVQSSSNKIFFQCREGKWYRGVKGDQGPFGACVGVYALTDSE